MITEAIRAWVLHQRAIGDGHTQVTFFTHEQGLVQARLQGGRSRKKQGLLQAFTPLWLMLDERPYGTYVRQVEMISAPHVIAGRYLISGLYVNELVYHALRPNEQDIALFQAYENAVTALVTIDSSERLEGILRCFEWALLESSGAHVSYVYEADGVSPITEQKQYVFVPNEGFWAVERGLSGAHLLAMAAGAFVSPDVLKTAKYIMRKAIDHVLDGALIHSRSLYRDVVRGES